MAMRLGRRRFIGSAIGFAVSGCGTLKTSSAEARLAAGAAEARRQLANGAMRGVALGTDGATAALGLRTFDPVESPMDVSCRFDVASITKPLVAAALARRRRGRYAIRGSPDRRYSPIRKPVSPPSC